MSKKSFYFSKEKSKKKRKVKREQEKEENIEEKEMEEGKKELTNKNVLTNSPRRERPLNFPSLKRFTKELERNFSAQSAEKENIQKKVKGSRWCMGW